MYPFATEIIEATRVADNRAEDALGAPDGVAVDFDNDGRTPSTVVVGFTNNILNRDGYDFSITYWDMPENQRHESSYILVKNDQYDFTRIGSIEPTPGLDIRHVTQVQFFDLDTLGWDHVTQIMVRNFTADRDRRHEGLDIDGFTAIHCDGSSAPPSDEIAIHTTGLRDTEATCWNRTNNDLVPARKDSDGNHSCAHLFTNRGDSIWLTLGGESNVRQ
ncbi:MAG: hypothetical protein ETSY1_13405 [Candidatus Entotheonella factor]|uniref:Uncharacterized protein n=1 Tax=Entotheonella factor TaxID=1429438 RepID=W4LQ78_ENTF1|nr:MAG: hypothetical protein ETSY1_13405 [Candidatus Entotheonella factor]